MPLTFDLPWEKLQSYHGTNPRPDDFDSFWDEGLAEMRVLPHNIKFQPAEFQTNFAECMDMYFTGTDGAQIYAKLLRPKNIDKLHPALLMFHGYGGNSGQWMDKLPYVAQGFTVAAMDCRGQGGKSQDTGGILGTTLRGHLIRGLDDSPSKLLYRQIFLDAAQLAGIIMDMDDVDANRIAVTGKSQGGGLALACAALEPRIRLAAPVFPFLCDYMRIWQMDLAKDAYAELKEYFTLFDPLHQREHEIFNKLGYIDIQHLAGRINAEIMFTTALTDTICPPSTQFAVYNKIKSKKSLMVYPDFSHDYLPGNDDAIFEFISKLSST